ncbi:hypothetical protein FKM82_006437 [Ascaphus truei]
MYCAFGGILAGGPLRSWFEKTPLGDITAKMVVLEVEELSTLERCLGLREGKYSSRAQGSSQIPVLQTNKGPSLAGLTTIASHLVKEAKKEELLGASIEEKALVQQWLEYRVIRIDRLSCKEDIRNILKDLNSYLEDKVYLAGNMFTLADILIYYGLHPIISHSALPRNTTAPSQPCLQ